jgi:rSAM/selenodomain-associated transferase 1
MSSEKLILIFVRNVQIGKVKTRLAKTIGDEKALIIYIHLLNRTAEVAAEVNAHKAVFYSEYIEEADEFMVPIFQKYLQNGNDLGDKMKNAFIKAFSRGYEKVVIIGSDCYDLSPLILSDAFDKLNTHDVVMGPAADGGYYLLGMKQLHKPFFTNKEWSTNNVLVDTLLDVKNEKLSYFLLPTLTDVDTEEDLNDVLKKAINI